MRLSYSHLKAFSAAALSLSRPATLAAFPARVFEALQPFLSCDYCAYHEFTKFAPVRNVVSPIYRPNLQAFVEFIHQHPSFNMIKARRLDSAVKISDFLTLSQWHRTDLHHYLFRPENQNYQLAFISQDPNMELGLALNRSSSDFTEDERQMLDLIQPHLIRAFHNSRLRSALARNRESEGHATLIVTRDGRIRFITERGKQLLEHYAGNINNDLLPNTVRAWLRTQLQGSPDSLSSDLQLRLSSGRLTIKTLSSVLDDDQHLVVQEDPEGCDQGKLRQLGLTPREAEVLFWVTQGKRNSEIGVILDVKPRTITKHIERIFQKLSVETRSAAVAIAIGCLRRAAD